MADSLITPEDTRRVLEELNLSLEHIMCGCLTLAVKFETLQKAQQFFINVFNGEYNRRLQETYFNVLRTVLCTLPDDLKKSGHVTLNKKERDELKTFLKVAVRSLSITIWMNLGQAVALMEKRKCSSSLEICIAVSGKKTRTQHCVRKLPKVDELKKDVSAALSRGSGSSATAATNLFLEDILAGKSIV